MSFSQGHALIIGVSKYISAAVVDVPQVVKDSWAVEKVLKDDNLCGYEESHVQVIQDEGATRSGILDALDAFNFRVAPQDTAFLFYCGHGGLGEDGSYYLVSHDAEFQSERVKPGSGVSAAELLDRIKELKARRVLLIFNTCFSGSISPTLAPGKPKLAASSLSEDMSSALIATGSGRIIITACRETQSSYIGEGELTVFTQALVDGLRGKAAGNSDEYISAYRLYETIYHTVSETVEAQWQGRQEPELTVLKGVGPFAVALHKGAHALGEFDESQPAPETPAVRRVTPEDAQHSYNIVMQAHASGAGSVAIAGSADGANIAAGNQGTVFNIQGGIHAGRDVVMHDQYNVITYQAEPQNPAEFSAALQKLQAEIAALRGQANLNSAQRSNLAAAQEKVAEAAGQAEQPAASGSRIRTALTEAKDTMELLAGGLQAAVSLGARIAALAALAVKLFGG